MFHESKCRTCGRLFIPAPEHALKDCRGIYCKPTCFLNRPAPPPKGSGRKTKPVEQCTLDGEVIAIYPGAFQAEVETGLLKSGIVRAITKKMVYHGYIWRYKDEKGGEGNG